MRRSLNATPRTPTPLMKISRPNAARWEFPKRSTRLGLKRTKCLKPRQKTIVNLSAPASPFHSATRPAGELSLLARGGGRKSARAARPAGEPSLHRDSRGASAAAFQTKPRRRRAPRDASARMGRSRMEIARPSAVWVDLRRLDALAIFSDADLSRGDDCRILGRPGGSSSDGVRRIQKGNMRDDASI